MTPRSGLYVAFVGLVMAGLCFAVLGILALLEESVPQGVKENPIGLGGIIFLDLGLLLGLIVIAVGLVLTGVLALTKQSGQPS